MHPVQSFCNSVMKGCRYVLIVLDGSEGPGISPTNIIFSRLYLNKRGRLSTVKKMTPTEYILRSKGLNQSMFNIKPIRFSCLKNNWPFSSENVVHIRSTIKYVTQ